MPHNPGDPENTDPEATSADRAEAAAEQAEEAQAAQEAQADATEEAELDPTLDADLEEALADSSGRGNTSYVSVEFISAAIFSAGV